MSLLIDHGNNKYTINLSKSTYSSYLSKDELIFTIDVKNIHCNTCDDIFEQVFHFVDKNYIKKDEEFDMIEHFDGRYTYTYVNEGKLLNILKEKATDALKTQMNEKMADEETKHADTSLLTALQEKAKDAFNKHVETEKKK